MGYLETHCADPWIEYGKKKSDIRKYLRRNNINVSSVEIYRKKDRLGPSCRSCGCYSGNEIELYAKDHDINLLTDIGFYLK